MSYAPERVTTCSFAAIINGEARHATAAFCVTKKGYVMMHPTEARFAHLLRKGTPIGILAWEHRNSLQQVWDAKGQLLRMAEGLCIVSDEEAHLFIPPDNTVN